jgi:predicted glycosyltransferase
MNWLIYALGGGWGHLNRSLSLARIAGKKHKVNLIINSPYYPLIKNNINHCFCYFIPPETDFEKTCEKTRDIILNNNYNSLIIDTFPRGLGGEMGDILPQIKAKKILIHRDINPNYIKAKNLQEFVLNNYDLILIPGDGENLPFAQFSNTYITAPWLIKNSEELKPVDQVYLLLKIKQKLPQQKIIIILASGNQDELEIYGEIAYILSQNSNYIVRCLAAIKPQNCPENIWQFYYPALDCLQIADLIIGGGGYNTISEAIALKIPLIVLAHARLYDRQLMRIKRVMEKYPNQIKLARNIMEITKMVNEVQNIKLNLNYKNGVLDGIKLIESLN